MENDHEFRAAVDEFLVRTRELIGRESVEDVPPPVFPNSKKRRSSLPAMLLLNKETIRRYALSIGDDNPVFTNPNYANASRYGGLIAPGPILVHARYPPEHGATRQHGYPLANFIGGVAWEFFDVVRAGTKISTSKVLREVFERPNLSGNRLIYLITEVTYLNQFERPLAKAYASLIQVPMRCMGTKRAIPVDKLGEELLTRRQSHCYQPQEIAGIVAGMKNERRRGNTPLFWEDVTVGDELSPIFQPPYSLQDALSYQSIHQGLIAGHENGRFARSFTPAYRVLKAGWGYPDFARVHPITRWPYTPGDEHEDALLCQYRGQPLPFDFGIQRAQIPQRLITNWAGDHGFCRKMSMMMGRPLFHGDALIVRGRVVNKSTVTETGSDVVHHAVRVAMEGVNQRGESVSRGFATVYLPQRDKEGPALPIQMAESPPYVPFDVHRSPSWY